MRGLDGVGVLVTGGSRGIGKATVRRFLQEGARVHLCGLEADEVEGARVELAPWGQVSGSTCDVSDAVQVERLVGEADHHLGQVDVLVSNAGVSWRRAFLDLSIEDWDQLMAVNLRGSFLVCRLAARAMAQRGAGAIVLTASTNALAAEVDYAHYNASKGAVLQLMRSMAVELGGCGIRVNAVCPGYIDTPLNRRIVADLDDPGFVQRYAEEAIPLRRIGTEDDVAAAIAFLASDEASFVTGAALVVDGGQTAVM